MDVYHYITIKEGKGINNFYIPSKKIIIEKWGGNLNVIDDAVSCSEAQKLVDTGKAYDMKFTEDFIQEFIDAYKAEKEAKKALDQANTNYKSAETNLDGLSKKLREMAIEQRSSK